MKNCGINFSINFLRPARLVFEGGDKAPTIQDLQRTIDAADREEAAKPKQPDMLKKDEETKADDLQKKIAEKIAAPGIKPDTAKAYKTFTEKHDKYEELKKAGEAVAQDRTELVTYLRDVLMKGGTDTALVAAYRKEAAAQKVIEEQQKQEAAKIEAGQKVEETKILANVMDFKLRHVPNMVKYARSNNPNNANNDINMLTVDLNGMAMDEAQLQKLKSGTPEEQAKNSYDIKNIEERLNRHTTTEWINKCRELNQVLVLTGVAPYQAFTPLAEAAQMGRKVGAMTTPGVAPAAPAAPQAPVRAPAAPPRTPPPAPAKPATTPPVAPQQPPFNRNLPMAEAPAAKPPAKPAAAPPPTTVARAPAPAPTPAAPAARPMPRTAAESPKTNENGEKYFTTLNGMENQVKSIFFTQDQQGFNKFRSSEYPQARVMMRTIEKDFKATPDETVAFLMPISYVNGATKAKDTAFVRIVIPNAYNSISNITDDLKIYNVPGIRFEMVGARVKQEEGGPAKVEMDESTIAVPARKPQTGRAPNAPKK